MSLSKNLKETQENIDILGSEFSDYSSVEQAEHYFNEDT